MLALAGIAAIFCRCRDDPAERVPRLDHHEFARTALAATSLETIHFGPEYCRRALSPEEGGEWGDGNERTGDEASSRGERSETAMADVTRAVEKAQEAVARIAFKAAAATIETESTSRYSASS